MRKLYPFLLFIFLSFTGFAQDGIESYSVVSDEINLVEQDAVQERNMNEVNPNDIIIDNVSNSYALFDYNIAPLSPSAMFQTINGQTDRVVDTSSLAPGLYVINIINPESGISSTYKFKKQ